MLVCGLPPITNLDLPGDANASVDPPKKVFACALRTEIMDFSESLENLFGSSLPDLSLRDPSSSFETLNTSTRDLAASHVHDFEHQKSSRPRNGPDISLPHEICFVALICLSMFTAQVGLGQVLNILYVVGDDFGIMSPGILSWFPAGYSLTAGTMVLVSGRLGDLFGYKRMLVLGYIWFALWSMVAGLAVYSNEILFIFARAFAGIGPAITMPNGLAIFGALYSDGLRKSMVFALFGACAPSGSIVGSAFAGLFALTWWPWTFWSFAIVLAVIALLSMFVIPDVPRAQYVRRSWMDLLEATDAVGALLGVASLVLINFAWNMAGVVGWSKAYVYICLILGLVVFLPAFFIVETSFATQPLIPFQVLTSEVGVVLSCVACGWASMGIWLFYLVQFYLVLREGSPLLVSAWFSPIAASGLCASITTGYLLGKIPATRVMVLALTFFTIGNILLATAPVDQTYWAQTFVCSLVIPWGMDMSFPAGTIIMSNSVPKEHQGVAASLMMTIVNYSISLGLGFAGTIETNINDGGTTPADVLHGFRGAWYMGIGLAGLGLCISLFFAIRDAFRSTKRTRKSQLEA